MCKMMLLYSLFYVFELSNEGKCLRRTKLNFQNVFLHFVESLENAVKNNFFLKIATICRYFDTHTQLSHIICNIHIYKSFLFKFATLL